MPRVILYILNCKPEGLPRIQYSYGSSLYLLRQDGRCRGAASQFDLDNMRAFSGKKQELLFQCAVCQSECSPGEKRAIVAVAHSMLIAIYHAYGFASQASWLRMTRQRPESPCWTPIPICGKCMTRMTETPRCCISRMPPQLSLPSRPHRKSSSSKK